LLLRLFCHVSSLRNDDIRQLVFPHISPNVLITIYSVLRTAGVQCFNFKNGLTIYYLHPMKSVIFDFLQTMFDRSSYSKKNINSKINIL
jgi:hypothetical protein